MKSLLSSLVKTKCSGQPTEVIKFFFRYETLLNNVARISIGSRYSSGRGGGGGAQPRLLIKHFLLYQDLATGQKT